MTDKTIDKIVQKQLKWYTAEVILLWFLAVKERINVKKIILTFLFLFASPILTQAGSIQTYIISFPDDPVKIKQAWAKVVEDEYSTKIDCELVAAVQGKDIKAAQFNFIFYDVFDEYLYTFGGITLNYAYAYLKIYPRWKPSFYNDWMSYTVIVYLDKVRFGDDTIWRQDENRVAEEIVKTTRVLFKKEQLEKKRKEK